MAQAASNHSLSLTFRFSFPNIPSCLRKVPMLESTIANDEGVRPSTLSHSLINSANDWGLDLSLSLFKINHFFILMVAGDWFSCFGKRWDWMIVGEGEGKDESVVDGDEIGWG
ncbi:hypothetical protein V6N11_073039 [Hibiscus sabdariffa]|uniref:Uncharacterized protein n=1 Tax=Hibiscus sabdariffa TaxID=183260 RepID=A0ABR2NX05_9ROSI